MARPRSTQRRLQLPTKKWFLPPPASGQHVCSGNGYNSVKVVLCIKYLYVLNCAMPNKYQRRARVCSLYLLAHMYTHTCTQTCSPPHTHSPSLTHSTSQVSTSLDSDTEVAGKQSPANTAERNSSKNLPGTFSNEHTTFTRTSVVPPPPPSQPLYVIIQFSSIHICTYVHICTYMYL